MTGRWICWASASSVHSTASLPHAWSEPTGPELCNPRGLARAGCPEEEHGVSWRDFLTAACRLCPAGRPCAGRPAVDPLLTIARRAVSEAAAWQCVPGLLSAMIVVAQFFLMRTEEDIKAQFDRALPLRPFPFDTSQYSLYTNMVAASLATCDAANSATLQNKFVPKVHPEDSGVCGMVYTDQQLVRRCRARRRGITEQSGTEFLQSITCPNMEINLDAELARKLHKYTERAESLQCQDHRGMWREDNGVVHKCVLVTIAHMLDFRPGQLLLDWGSGCGHTLTWAKTLFDVDGLGIDIEASAVAWARDHSAGSFCHADGRNLAWIPDGIFNHVFSYAAIYHLDKADQCWTVVQLIEKLRVGGRAFFGWNHLPHMNNWEWESCFREMTLEKRRQGTPLQVEMEAIEDGFMFPPDVKQAKDTFLYHFPAYSILLTRVA